MAFAKLLLLDDSDYTYQCREASLSQYTQATFEGLGEVNQDDLVACFEIFVEGVAIGRLHQNEEDDTWTAYPVGSGSASRYLPVSGFSHELYAAKYLEETALEKGLLDHTTRVVHYNL